MSKRKTKLLSLDWINLAPNHVLLINVFMVHRLYWVSFYVGHSLVLLNIAFLFVLEFNSTFITYWLSIKFFYLIIDFLYFKTCLPNKKTDLHIIQKSPTYHPFHCSFWVKTKMLPYWEAHSWADDSVGNMPVVTHTYNPMVEVMIRLLKLTDHRAQGSGRETTSKVRWDR